MNEIDLSGLNLGEKEERILKSAIKIFSEKGFDSTTSSEIAKDAGVAEGTIFKYFKTKKNILKSIIIHLLNIVSGKLVLTGIKDILLDQKNPDMKTTLKRVIYDRLKLVDTIFPMARILLIEVILHEEVRDAIYENIIKNALVMFEDFYKSMSQKGLIRDDIDPETIFRTILGNIGVFIAQKKFFGKYFPETDQEKEIDIMVEIILRGIEKR